MSSKFFHAPTEKLQTLTEFLKNDPLKLTANFIKSFEKMEQKQQLQQVQQLITAGNQFEFIVKLATINSKFREICSLPLFNETWLSNWSTYGCLITKDVNKALYSQPCENVLELFLGIFFYYKAIKTAEIMKVNFSQIEINYLKQAIAFNSVHAYQRYYSYLYRDTEVNFDNAAVENLDNRFDSIINNIKKNILPYYGSYGYLMLTEAYFYYGIYLHKKNLDSSSKAIKAALESFNFTLIERLNVHDFTLCHNASLGNTIPTSSFLNLENLDKIKALILNQKTLITDQQENYFAQNSSLLTIKQELNLESEEQSSPPRSQPFLY